MAAALFSIKYLTMTIHNFSPYWLANGVFVGAYLSSRHTFTRQLMIPVLLIANCVATIISTSGVSYIAATAFAFVSTAESLGVALGTCYWIALLRRWTRPSISGAAQAGHNDFVDNVELTERVEMNDNGGRSGRRGDVQIEAGDLEMWNGADAHVGDEDIRHISMEAPRGYTLNEASPSRSLAVTSDTPKLSQSRSASTSVSFDDGWHLFAFLLACLWCIFSAVAGAYASSLVSDKEFLFRYITWLGRSMSGIGMIAPVIITGRSLPARLLVIHPQIYRIPLIHPRNTMLSLILISLIFGTPLIFSKMMPGGALPTIAAVYVDFPFVLLSAWMGDTFAASSSMALVALWKAGLSGIGQSWGNCIDVTIDIQFIADQLLLLVLLGTALVFAVVLQDRDRVLKNVEDLMRQQTLRNEEDLAFVLSAKQGAKESRSEQAAMMAFLCHELRNPLHAIANMADFLVEDLSVKGTSRSSQESKVSGAAHLDCLHELTDMSKRELERNPFDYYIFQSPDRAVGANTPPCSRHGSVSVSPYQSSVAIKLSSVYMLTLVTDILDLGSLESAGATTNNALTHLSTLLTASFTCAFDLCHQVGVEFSFKIEEDTPLWVWTDSVRMQQILNNLIGNARKFTRTGGRIWVDVEIENRWWGDRDGGDGPDADEVRIAIKNDIEILPYNDNNDEHAPGDAPGIHDVFESDATMNDVKPESSPSYSSSSSPPSTSLRALSQGHPPSEWVLLKISVHDTGIGISPDDLPKLFRPYALPTGSMTHEYGGAGLGLAITDKIVRLLRGRIEVKTELGLGSVFTVLIPLRVGKGETDVRLAKETLNDQSVHIAGTLDEMAKTTGTVRAARRKIFVDDVIALEPLRLPLAEEILPSMVPPPAQTTSSSHLQSGIPFSLHLPAKRVASRVLPPIPSTAPLNPCILVVDDSQINRSILIRMIKQALKPTQPTIIEAINGSEAVTTVSTFPRFDLIFMDIQMPLLNGFEATKQIREMGCTSPVVVASANQILGNAEAQERMKEVGADEALGKPFLKGQVGDCMKRWGVI